VARSKDAWREVTGNKSANKSSKRGSDKTLPGNFERGPPAMTA